MEREEEEEEDRVSRPGQSLTFKAVDIIVPTDELSHRRIKCYTVIRVGGYIYLSIYIHISTLTTL